MKRVLIALVAVMLIAGSADAKILGIVAKTSTGQGNNTLYQRNNLEIDLNALGVAIDYYMASDTSGIDSAWATGDYTKAVIVNLPTLSGSYDSNAEMVAIGWTRLRRWIDRSHAGAFPGTLVVLVPQDLPLTGIWAFARTGQLGVRADGTTLYNYSECPITNAAGDSIYVNCHFKDGRDISRIPDSLSWVATDLLFDVAGPTAHQDWSPVWHTIGTGGHKVYYITDACKSAWTLTTCAIMAQDEKICPIEVPIFIDGFGYYSSSWSADTNGLYLNVPIFFDAVVSYGMKVDIGCNTYQYVKGQNLQNKYPQWETQIAAHPDNLRYTHATVSNWNTATDRDWFGALGDRTQAEITLYIQRSLDSTDVAVRSGNIDQVISKTRAMAYGGFMNGYATTPSQLETYHAIANTALTEIYIRGNCYGEMPGTIAATKTLGLVYPARKFFRKTDGTIREVDFYPVSRDFKGLWNAASTLANIQPLNQGTTTAAAAVNRGVYSPTWIRHIVGQYFMNKNVRLEGTESAEAAQLYRRYSAYQPGILFPAAMLTGGAATPTNCNLLEVLRDLDAHKNIADTIAGQAVIKYCWMEDVKWNRSNTGGKWADSHVIRE